jgi:hypothetical protein
MPLNNFPGYDLVRNIHGHADTLHRLLRALEFAEIEGAFTGNLKIFNAVKEIQCRERDMSSEAVPLLSMGATPEYQRPLNRAHRLRISTGLK